MITIGNPNTFAFAIRSNDLSSELADIALIVAGTQVSGRSPVYVPTFVGELRAFLKSHESKPPDKDFSCMTHEDVFGLFHDISERDRRIEGVTPDDVWNYHRMHSIDDAVDDWEIYVFDTAGEKHIVCRAMPCSELRGKGGQLVVVTLSRKDFISTLTDFLDVFNGRGKGDAALC